MWLIGLLVGDSDGFSNTEVGEMLGISGHTVRNYLSTVFART
jgi:DNA-binding CsgD family transcriptional regulator